MAYPSPPRFQLMTPPRESPPSGTATPGESSTPEAYGLGIQAGQYAHYLESPGQTSRLTPLNPDDVTSRQLWVRNLPYSFSWQDLKDLMRTACTKGSVLRSDVSLDTEGRSKGYGSVVFETLEDAKAAAMRFHGFDLNGRKIIIQPVRAGRAEQLTAEGRQLFVTNMPFNLRWQDLKQLFRMAGNVQRADVLLSGEGLSKGIGVVVFETKEEADRAILMFDGFSLEGRRLRVRPDKLGHLAFISNHQTAPTKTPTSRSPNSPMRHSAQAMVPAEIFQPMMTGPQGSNGSIYGSPARPGGPVGPGAGGWSPDWRHMQFPPHQPLIPRGAPIDGETDSQGGSTFFIGGEYHGSNLNPLNIQRAFPGGQFRGGPPDIDSLSVDFRALSMTPTGDSPVEHNLSRPESSTSTLITSIPNLHMLPTPGPSRVPSFSYSYEPLPIPHSPVPPGSPVPPSPMTPYIYLSPSQMGQYPVVPMVAAMPGQSPVEGSAWAAYPTAFGQPYQTAYSSQ
ncbi:RNA-binding domain-containing protein [Gonapodya prolifera JEL478]|uniref:RNA-binding domain-containing protein n=1 Tax=Gonapodya prolifera (strain JEL478) TaxID=1344416 RepID=A0A139A679_GONPJ|nr:RNA-binding domain-containing protein [Gonapodya prolifera JEL478]|eukprot:KXS12261.1 RNA-binding domain-containing protein [Gonapodya prolifera JEL478]